MIQEIFSKRLLELMEEQDMNQTELANKIGTTNVTISRYISCQRKPRIEIVGRIAVELHTSIDYLLGFTDTKHYAISPNEAYQEMRQILEENNEPTKAHWKKLKNLFSQSHEVAFPALNSLTTPTKNKKISNQ